MVTAAVLFIVVDYDATIQILSAAVFVIGAVVLYFLMGSTQDFDETQSDQDMSEQRKKSKKKKRPADATLPLSFEEEKEKSGADAAGSKSAASGKDASSEAPMAARASASSTVRLPYKPKEIEIPEDYYKYNLEAIPTDPRGEFDYLTLRLLTVLKEMLFAHTVGVFWINRDRGQIVIGSHVTDSKQFTPARRYPLTNDLLGRVAESKRPEIISEIPTEAEAELLPYYNSNQGVHSFVGVPMFFQDDCVAILAADSKAPDSFGLETVATMGHFTALLATLLQSYSHKYDLEADSKLLKVIDNMRQSIALHLDPYGIASAAATATTEAVDWDYVAVVLNEPSGDWVVKRSVTKMSEEPYIKEGTVIDLENGLVGKVLQSMEPVIVDAPTEGTFRFERTENIRGNGSLCLVPLTTANRCFGIIVAEYKEKHQYAGRDLEIIQRIAEIVSMALEVLSLNTLVRQHLMIDESTRVASRTFLLQRLDEERKRCEDHGGEMSFYVVALDHADQLLQRHGLAGLEYILKSLGSALRSSLEPYHVLGKLDQSRFGVLCLHTGGENAYLVGEKFRTIIASTSLSLDGSSFSVTASIGCCVYAEGMDSGQILNVAQQVVDRAISDGGNCVKVV